MNERMGRTDFRAIVERLPLVVYVDAIDDRARRSTSALRSTGSWATPQESGSRIRTCSSGRSIRTTAPASWPRSPRGTATARPFPSRDYRLVARDGRVVWVRDDETRRDETARRTPLPAGRHRAQARQHAARVAPRVLALAAADAAGRLVAHAAGKLADSSAALSRHLRRRSREGGFEYPLHDGRREARVLGRGRLDLTTTSRGSSTRRAVVVEDVNEADPRSTRSASSSDERERRLVRRRAAPPPRAAARRPRFNSSRAAHLGRARGLHARRGRGPARRRPRRTRAPGSARARRTGPPPARRDPRSSQPLRGAPVRGAGLARRGAPPCCRRSARRRRPAGRISSRRHRGDGGRWRANQRFEWVEAGSDRGAREPGSCRTCASRRSGSAGSPTCVERRRVYSADVRELPAAERSALRVAGDPVAA